MSEMIERVAKAMWESSYTTEWDSSHIDAYLTEKFRSRAAIAIEALREPTDAMVNCGRSIYPPDQDCIVYWKAMIDEALK